MRVVDAGQQADAGRQRSAQVAAVAALCCCTSLPVLAWPRSLVTLKRYSAGLSVGGRSGYEQCDVRLLCLSPLSGAP